jgi:2-dehydro-3-deoxy-D-arabinonate dehydratase
LTSPETPTDVVESGVRGLFRVALPDGSVRLAVGDTRTGPTALLASDRTIADILRAGREGLNGAVAGPTAGRVPTDATILAPLDAQEVWAAGVTYRRSHEARVEEASEPSVYDKIYVADRPELFFKATPARVRATAEAIGIRSDSSWDVPEPELILVVTPSLEIAGFALGDDVSSRSIEGDNALYLPQAKFYRWSCAIGPALVPANAVPLPLDISLTVRRGTAVAFAGSTSTAACDARPRSWSPSNWVQSPSTRSAIRWSGRSRLNAGRGSIGRSGWRRMKPALSIFARRIRASPIPRSGA